jgi:RNA polymerase sigma-70 factor (ECF subfamily)
MGNLATAKIAHLSTRPPSSAAHEDLAEQRIREASALDFRTLYQDYKSKVYGTVLHVVGRTTELDDIVQNVFLEIHRSLPRYKGNSKLSTWIYRIAVNVSLQYIRKRKRRKVFLFFDADRSVQEESLSHELGGRYESRDLMNKLQGQLEKLSDKKRVVFVLHEIEGLPVDRIAEICEVPVNTVRSRLNSARTEVMARMRKQGMLEGKAP